MAAGMVRSVLLRCVNAQRFSQVVPRPSRSDRLLGFKRIALANTARHVSIGRELSDGWRAIYSPDYGREYFWHETSGATTWALPVTVSTTTAEVGHAGALAADESGHNTSAVAPEQHISSLTSSTVDVTADSTAESDDRSSASTSEVSQGRAECRVHGKIRTIENLTTNEEGHLVCMPGGECRKPPERSSERAMCEVHGKIRLFHLLETNAQGQMACTPGSECVPIDVRLKDSGSSVCYIHKAIRTADNLKQNEDGHLVCITGQECDRKPPFEYCQVHGARRAVKFVASDQQGGFVCIAGYECQKIHHQNPQVRTELPPHWQVAWSDEHKREYFWHEVTGETTWDAPAASNVVENGSVE